MRIAIFTDTFLPNINGVVTSVVNSSTNLAKRGHKILIFTSKARGHHEKVFLHKNIKVEHFPIVDIIDYPDFHLAMPHPKLLKRMIEFKPQVIHSNMPSLLGWEAVFCSSVFDIPLVGTYHTLLPDFLEHLRMPQFFNRSSMAKRITWDYTSLYYNRCDIVTTPSTAMREELIRHGITKPVRFLSNGVDLRKFRPIRKRKDGATILHIGRISYEKKIDVLIRAFKILMKKNPKAKLILGGKGPDVERLKRLSGREWGKRIIFMGMVEHKKLPEIYSSADVFATASTVETEGLVILEAMGCGLPIAAVKAMAIPHIVHHGKNGLLSKPGNARELARNLDDLLKDRSKRERFGKESLKIVRNFSLDKVINDLESMYSSLVKNKKPSYLYKIPKVFSNPFR